MGTCLRSRGTPLSGTKLGWCIKPKFAKKCSCRQRLRLLMRGKKRAGRWREIVSRGCGWIVCGESDRIGKDKCDDERD